MQTERHASPVPSPFGPRLPLLLLTAAALGLAVSAPRLGAGETGKGEEAEALRKQVRDLQKQVEALNRENQALRKQIVRLQINARPENQPMLRQLQADLKAAEGGYRQDIAAVQGQVAALKRENEGLRKLLKDQESLRAAEAALREAEAAHQAAEGRFRQAREAVERALREVGQEKKDRPKAPEQENSKAPHQARKMHEEARRLLARVEDLNEKMNAPKAEPLCRQALKLFRDLVAEYPRVPEYRGDLARAFSELGELLKLTGRIAEAEATFRQALRIQSDLARDHPDVRVYRLELARSTIRLGGIHVLSGRLAEAVRSAQQGVTVLGKLREQANPPDQATLRGLYQGYYLLHQALRLSGRGEEAAAVLERVKSVQQQLNQAGR